ncbi:FadR/GntR family transcriptional regulator [Paraburkholderia youngii]|uniref:FadR/GntR family transcriptional regulator n=1 Tax=Paraburkholderia youngii TaxID=2782701 RepID=UPI003D1F26A4
MEQGNKEGSLVSKVVDGLVTGIVSGRYGAILPPQDVLSQEFGVSRTVMREALSMLLARDMLDVRPKTGTRIRPVSDWRMIDEDVISWRCRRKPDPLFLRDAIELRMLIEPRASALAATRATSGDIAAIREAFQALRAIGPADTSYHGAAELFHTRIVRASGNQFFKQMAAIIRGALSAAPPFAGGGEGAWDGVVRLHQRVLDAITLRDPKEAEIASRALIECSASEITEGGDLAPRKKGRRSSQIALA